MNENESFFEEQEDEKEESIENVLREEEIKFLNYYGLKRPLDNAKVSIDAKVECTKLLREEAQRLVNKENLNPNKKKDKSDIYDALIETATNFLTERKDKERNEKLAA